jgi:hypothetical protein
MRVLAIGLAIAVIVFVVSAGHVPFLPLLCFPLALFFPVTTDGGNRTGAT